MTCHMAEPQLERPEEEQQPEEEGHEEEEQPPSYDASNRLEEFSRTTVILNEEQNHVLNQVLSGKSTLITGPAGVGKSLLCKHICSELDKRGKIYRIVAPTGVAA